MDMTINELKTDNEKQEIKEKEPITLALKSRPFYLICILGFSYVCKINF